MIPSVIIDKALTDTHTNSTNYDPATLWLEALNIVSDYINNEIVQSVREDYFWDYQRVVSVVWQSEYVIKTWQVNWDWTSTTVNIKKVNKLFVKYDATDTYYTRAEYINPDTLEKDVEYYEATQSKTTPFFYIQDRSVFLYPAPDAIVANGLKMNAIYTPPAIAFASPETWLPLQPDKHYIYSLGIEWQIYKSQGKLNEANSAKQIFEQELIKVMKYMKSRSNAPKKKTITGLDDFR